MIANFAPSAKALGETLKAKGITHPDVLAVLSELPRHQFIDAVLHHKAYDDTALPIGQGQTISQPFIVAQMTELLLQYGVRDKVLEIGTGSGYQTAVLAKLFSQVYSVERIKALQWQAKRKLHQCDIYNVMMKHADGWHGWSSHAPYQGIIVTAAPEHVPEALLSQLAEGGVMVAPIGKESQFLRVYQRIQGQIRQTDIAPVRFVPLVAGNLE